MPGGDEKRADTLCSLSAEVTGHSLILKLHALFHFQVYKLAVFPFHMKIKHATFSRR